ncbi:unnamed protein product (macronuclear) [Paramecium tetraurelia]|uniref:Transmembrane protein n=1 Tax=Paramecium tetraurelia TaxID=5888 RepID=A0BWI5_PARTE|nr:uncharacterized protein GSPATT00032754001 [Paramecium tetraurelia]CAK62902.1 unnamed protein product [Paramecium tetraurelia]|eukprot:XP_001430300.1 hypothetical protein (macronuclear) [Paramecium tetraurelia strain d4-2]
MAISIIHIKTIKEEYLTNLYSLTRESKKMKLLTEYYKVRLYHQGRFNSILSYIFNYQYLLQQINTTTNSVQLKDLLSNYGQRKQQKIQLDEIQVTFTKQQTNTLNQ